MRETYLIEIVGGFAVGAVEFAELAVPNL